MDVQGKVVGVGDFCVQCVQVFENLWIVLCSVGLGFSDVVCMDMYVIDLSQLVVLCEVCVCYLLVQVQVISMLLKVDGLFWFELMIEVVVEVVFFDYCVGK